MHQKGHRTTKFWCQLLASWPVGAIKFRSRSYHGAHCLHKHEFHKHHHHTWKVSAGAPLGAGEDAICTAGSSRESRPQLGWLFFELGPSKCHTAIWRSPSEADRACIPSGENAMARTGSCTAAVKDGIDIAVAALFLAQRSVVTGPIRVHIILSSSRQHTRHTCFAWF